MIGRRIVAVPETLGFGRSALPVVMDFRASPDNVSRVREKLKALLSDVVDMTDRVRTRLGFPEDLLDGVSVSDFGGNAIAYRLGTRLISIRMGGDPANFERDFVDSRFQISYWLSQLLLGHPDAGRYVQIPEVSPHEFPWNDYKRLKITSFFGLPDVLIDLAATRVALFLCEPGPDALRGLQSMRNDARRRLVYDPHFLAREAATARFMGHARAEEFFLNRCQRALRRYRKRFSAAQLIDSIHHFLVGIIMTPQLRTNREDDAVSTAIEL